MGQYFAIYNLDKEQMINPGRFNDGLRLREFGSSSCGVLLALAALLAHGNEYGGIYSTYWTPFGDEVMWETGWSRATGNWAVWLTFVRHPRIAPALRPYHLGSSEHEATHWLLLDRHERTLSVGPGEAVYAFLRERNQPATWIGEPDANAEPLVIDAAFLEAFVEQMEELQSTVTAEELYANLADQDLQLQRLQAWLDAHTG